LTLAQVQASLLESREEAAAAAAGATLPSLLMLLTISFMFDAGVAAVSELQENCACAQQATGVSS
jgi:hypothetical protein